jgi:tRNA A37 threonylcarbamoyladenosine biosynthesis protein TsaE
VILLEWAEKALVLLPEEHLQVKFEVISARRRELTLVGFGERFGRLLEELEAA